VNLKEAQQKMVASIQADPERVILAAIIFNPSTAEIVEAVRKTPGTVQGVAAAAVKYALKGGDNTETSANIIRFMEELS